MKKLIVGIMLLMATGLIFSQDERDAAFRSNKNDRGNRYEGSYTRKVKGGGVYLISFVTSIPKYQFNDGQSLDIQWYSPESTEVFIKAEELKVEQYYWMEVKETSSKANSGKNNFGPWGVDGGLRQHMVYPDNLGMVIRERKDKSIFYPVFWKLDGEALPARYYIMRLRAERAISGGSYRITYQNSDGKPVEIKNAPIQRFSGGMFQNMAVKLEDLPVTGWYTVEVTVIEENSGTTINYPFKFYHFKE